MQRFWPKHNQNLTSAAYRGYERGMGDFAVKDQGGVDRGVFMPDGSYDEDGPPFQRKGTDRLTRHLVGLRQKASISPTEAAGQILEAGGSKAFPNASQWASCSFWPLAIAETSCEAVVKYCGGGSQQEMHWCGENWIQGRLKDCSNPDHWRKTPPEDVSRFFDTMRRAFG